jgi:hypothetical protein
MIDGNEAPLTASYYNVHPLVVFDDVFVPMERVFLNKEWQFSGQIAHMFGNFHRVFPDTYKIAQTEILVGVAALLAIVWLYRGQRNRFLDLLARHLFQTLYEAKACLATVNGQGTPFIR